MLFLREYALLIVLLFGLSALTASSPLTLVLKNNTLSSGIAINRGVGLELNGELLSIRLTTLLNNVRLRNSKDCPENRTLETECQGSSGSVYDLDKYPFDRVGEEEWSQRVVADPYHPGDIHPVQGFATANITTTPQISEISNLPIQVWSNKQSSNKSGLALGPSSSFVKRLFEMGVVPGTSWGLFFGSRSQLNSTDGALVVGGYDNGRKDPDASWEYFPTSPGYLTVSCPLQVLISDVRLGFADGSQHSLFAETGTILPACIDPQKSEFTFTKAMTDRLKNLTEHAIQVPSAGPNFTDQIYPLSKRHLMHSLTVVLSNGYTTVIPEYELVSQERGTNEYGEYKVINSSRIMISVSSSVFASKAEQELDNNIVPILGGVFLSQNYLRVDYKRGNFSMARARLGNYNPELISVFDPDQVQHANRGISKRDIEIASGGFVFGLVLAAGVYFGRRWWRRRKRRLTLAKPATPGSADDDFPCCRELELATVGCVSFKPQDETSTATPDAGGKSELMSNEKYEAPSPVLGGEKFETGSPGDQK